MKINVQQVNPEPEVKINANPEVKINIQQDPEITQQDLEECWICYCELWRLKRNVLPFPLEKIIQIWSVLWCVQCVSGSIWYRIENFVTALRYHIIIGKVSVLVLTLVFIIVTANNHNPLHFDNRQIGLLIACSIMSISWCTCRHVYHLIKDIPEKRSECHYL